MNRSVEFRRPFLFIGAPNRGRALQSWAIPAENLRYPINFKMPELAQFASAMDHALRTFKAHRHGFQGRAAQRADHPRHVIQSRWRNPRGASASIPH